MRLLLAIVCVFSLLFCGCQESMVVSPSDSADFNEYELGKDATSYQAKKGTQLPRNIAIEFKSTVNDKFGLEEAIVKRLTSILKSNDIAVLDQADYFLSIELVMVRDLNKSSSPRSSSSHTRMAKVRIQTEIRMLDDLQENIFTSIVDGMVPREDLTWYLPIPKETYLLASEKAMSKLSRQMRSFRRSEIASNAIISKNYTSKQNKNKVDNWAVIVGLSEYANNGQDGLSNLVYADDDAMAFANTLTQQGWSSDHIKLLVNKQATERNIKIALESWLTKAGPDDMVVLFWSGHGFPDPADPEKVYFACYDTDIRIPATGYRMDKVRAAVEELGVRNVVMLADTCHAGKLITRGNEKAIGITPYVNSLAKKRNAPKGWIFMVASDVDRKAIEDSSWSHGAFTHCLLKALKGAADGYQSAGAEDGTVTMGELRAFMSSEMPDETQRILGVAKRPTITTSTGDPGIWDLSLMAK